MDSACKKILSKYPELQFAKDTGKIKCSLSGHEMPCRVDALKSYVSGKKFAKLKANHDFNFSKLEPFLVPSKKRKYQLFCALTNRYLNRKPDEVTGHINGWRYKQAMARYNAGELTLFKEKVKGSVVTDLAVEDDRDGDTEVLPFEGKTSHGKDSSQESPEEEGFWAPDGDDKGKQSHPKSEGGEDDLPMEEEGTAASEEESTSLGKGKKRKRLTQAVGILKRKKLGSSRSKTFTRTKKSKKVN